MQGGTLGSRDMETSVRPSPLCTDPNSPAPFALAYGAHTSTSGLLLGHFSLVPFLKGE